MMFRLARSLIPSRYSDACPVLCYSAQQGVNIYSYAPFKVTPLEAANFSCEPPKRFPSQLSVSRYGTLKYFCKEAKWLQNDTPGFSTFFLGIGQNSRKEMSTSQNLFCQHERFEKKGLMVFLLWISSGLPPFSSYYCSQNRKRENVCV